MKTSFAVLLISFAAIGYGQKAVQSKFNFGFEQFYPDSPLPYQWFDSWGSGYVVKPDTIEKHEAKRPFE
ncbi:MAG: hypothetical protein WDN75_02780 [Bacteroidota bacterium]